MAGNRTINICIHLSSVNIFEINPLNKNIIKHKTIDTITEKIKLEESIPFSFLLSLSEIYLAVFLEIIKGKPLATIVSKTIKIENETWYTPSASAPIVRDKYIRKKNPAIRVIIEKKVISATALNNDFIISPNYCILLGQSSNYYI